MRALAGSLCVLAAGLLAWRCQRESLRRRREALADLTAALERLEEEIRLARTPLPALLEGLARDCRPDAAALFTRAAQAARQGGSPRRAWEEAVGALPLEEADREALAGLTLSGDEERVRREVELARVRLERSLAALEARRPEDEKRSAALCLSAAALLVILLI